MKFKKFNNDKRGTLFYTIWHIIAFNYTAIKLGVWKFRYLFHDAEKPWLMLFFLGDYDKVRKWHKSHNRHHLGYKGKKEKDWQAMVIDWECGRLTKIDKPKTAIETANYRLHNGKMEYKDYCIFITTAKQMGLKS